MREVFDDVKSLLLYQLCVDLSLISSNWGTEEKRLSSDTIFKSLI